MAGLNLFLRACPSWLVAEHEEALDGRTQTPDESSSPAGATPGPTIDGRYRRMA
jgi:hypothetical protein